MLHCSGLLSIDAKSRRYNLYDSHLRFSLCALCGLYAFSLKNRHRFLQFALLSKKILYLCPLNTIGDISGIRNNACINKVTI